MTAGADAAEATPGARWAAAAAAAIQAVIVLALFAASADAAGKLWQTPAKWTDLLVLTPLGAGFASALYLGAAVWSLKKTGRPLSLLANLALLTTPYLFNLLLVLASPALTEQLGRWVLPGATLAAPALMTLGRVLVLLLFNELVLLGVGLLMDRRWSRRLRLHALIVACSVLAALSPEVARLGSSPALAALPAGLHLLPLVLAAALAQAGLWAQTFLVTGILLDALRDRRPTPDSSLTHWRAGLTKGAIYGGLFILLVHLLALAMSSARLLQIVTGHPLIGGALGGLILFPLAKTIVESFDGSAPFLRRLRVSATQPESYLRGAIAGAGLAYLLAMNLPADASGTRFGYGFAVGALAYGGADLLRDIWDVPRGLRRRLQSWRVYGFGALLGGAVAGSLAWYFDAAQLAAVISKFWAYAAINNPAAGRPVDDYVIYPLFSKWGAIRLGAVEGGVRLFYNESLSGVINWSLAAPLFGINLIALTALFQRSLAPLRGLFSGTGMTTLVEQTVRVLRWGLWMAPVIYSFLRLAPDPTWYNQDGAIRTLVASFQSWTLAPEAFRSWSLQVFLGLLAYDWLRVLVWFDHMGLRVATLVNLSFVGGDALDEKAARFLGHSARTRVIPEGIRRFLTWAPLLIPFYIPRGAEWDQVWNQAEPLHAAGGPVLPEVAALMIGYRVAALALSGLALAALVAWLRRAPRRAAQRKADARFAIGNGMTTVELGEDGCGFSRVVSSVRKGYVLDITRRPDDPLQLRGKFFYLRELDAGAVPSGEPWSLTRQPLCKTGSDYAVTRASPTSLRIVNSYAGIRAEALVSVADGEPAETWRVQLRNLQNRPRVIELTSYQELALAAVDSYRRTPPFAAIHVGTWFVRSLGAVIGHNRLLRDAQNDPRRRRMSREVAYHAARTDAQVQLVGYEDSRAHFIGAGTRHAPAALDGRALRSPDDEGLLYSFDPAACLRLRVQLPADGSAEVLFVDGYALDAAQAAQDIVRHLGLPPVDDTALRATLARTRRLHVDARPTQFAYSADGTELKLGWDTPRPWTHLLANAAGHGAIVSNEGEIFSFAANAQQNALTPFNLDSISALSPGQAIYVMDLDRGEADTAGFIPFRRADAQHEVIFGRGYAVFRKSRGDLELELTAVVVPDRPVELRLLRIRNRAAQPKRLRVVPYAEIVLAEVPADSRGKLKTQADANLGALLFANPANDFRKGWAFAATSLDCEANETVRSRFVGAGRDFASPYFVEHGRADSAPDDGVRCAGFAGTLVLPAGGEAFVVVVMGQAPDPEQARELIRAYRDPQSAQRALAETRRWWEQKLSGLQIETNRPEFDRLVNHWLPYQLLTSRLWGRVGASQRSGAFGFRDQLQDVLPLVFTHPQLARKQIVLHAAQQFLEGDVLKWWHLSWEGRTGIGVRTAAADPHLWLPYVVSRYVAATGDGAVLDEVVPFIEGKPLPHGVEGILIAPRSSRDGGSVYEHCRRAIELALSRKGRHGIPLLGSGDWNDGIDVAGLQGRGESMWMGFFLHEVLLGFAPLAERCAGASARTRYLEEAGRLSAALVPFRRGDGYARATSDDGEELEAGSALMAAWPALSGAVDLDRGLRALESGLALLEKENRVLLMPQPFDEKSRPYPGRVADYPPGVRENGGQYSHGVSWIIDAFLRCAEQAHDAGRDELAGRCRARAFEIWLKISPLSKTGPEDLPMYGLPPHQQPADVYHGPGYEGRGGWSWYTGAAARMLSAAYALLGLRMEGGELKLEEHAFAAKGALQLKRLVYRGKVMSP
jgi:cyclic beta-1,2-glucan synthetase